MTETQIQPTPLCDATWSRCRTCFCPVEETPDGPHHDPAASGILPFPETWLDMTGPEHDADHPIRLERLRFCEELAGPDGRCDSHPRQGKWRYGASPARCDYTS